MSTNPPSDRLKLTIEQIQQLDEIGREGLGCLSSLSPLVETCNFFNGLRGQLRKDVGVPEENIEAVYNSIYKGIDDRMTGEQWNNKLILRVAAQASRGGMLKDIDTIGRLVGNLAADRAVDIEDAVSFIKKQSGLDSKDQAKLFRCATKGYCDDKDLSPVDRRFKLEKYMLGLKSTPFGYSDNLEPARRIVQLAASGEVAGSPYTQAKISGLVKKIKKAYPQLHTIRTQRLFGRMVNAVIYGLKRVGYNIGLTSWPAPEGLSQT